jgi:hypothetical protein
MLFLMRKLLLCCAIIVISLNINAQAPLKINNTITSEHQRVEGTKIYMIIPEDFESVAEMIGFRQIDTDNSLIIRESAGSYKELRQTFLTENLTVRGIKIEEMQKLSLNGDEAMFYRLTQKVHRTVFTKLLLFYGDDDYCVLLSAVMKQQDGKRTEERFKNAMFSIAYKEDNATQILPKGIYLNLDHSSLKFARSFGDAVIYTINGSTSQSALAECSLFVGNGQKKDKEDKATFAQERFKKQSKSPITITQQAEVTINGLNGYEMIGTTTIEDKTRWLHQVLLFQDEKYYILMGSTMQEGKLVDFQRIAKTFKLD